MHSLPILRPLFILSFVACTLVVLSGCKVSVMVSSGGDVVSASTTRDCSGTSTCEFESTDATFAETFTAVPKPGYVFDQWLGGSPWHLCAGSTDPVCAVSNGVIAGTALEPLIPGGWIFHLTPLFTFVGVDTDDDGQLDYLDEDDDNDGVLDIDDNCPLLGPNQDGFGCLGLSITDTVFVDGKEWARPAAIASAAAGLTDGEVWEICPGACRCDVTMGGYNMCGWTYADLSTIVELLNYYIPPGYQPFLDNGDPSQFSQGFEIDLVRPFVLDFFPTGGGSFNSSWGACYLNPSYGSYSGLQQYGNYFRFFIGADGCANPLVGRVASNGGYFWRPAP